MESQKGAMATRGRALACELELPLPCLGSSGVLGWSLLTWSTARLRWKTPGHPGRQRRLSTAENCLRLMLSQVCLSHSRAEGSMLLIPVLDRAALGIRCQLSIWVKGPEWDLRLALKLVTCYMTIQHVSSYASLTHGCY